MIKKLKIENFLLINNEELIFGNGFNILSGETGSGKSIILKAIMLITGNRISKTNNQNDQKTKIEATFSMTNLLSENLKKNELDNTYNEVVVFREFNENGSNKIRINGELVSLKVLNSVLSGVIDFHGQHQSQVLFDKKEYLKIVDLFWESDLLLRTYSLIYREYFSLKKDLAEKNRNALDVNDKLEILSYKINDVDEVQAIEDIITLEERKANLSRMLNEFKSSEELIYQTSELSKKLTDLVQGYQGSLTDEQKEQLNNAVIAVDEVNYSLSSTGDIYSLQNEYDQVTDELSKVKTFIRKYRLSIDEVLNFCEKIKSDYDYYQNLEEDTKIIERKIITLEEELKKEAQKITEERKKASFSIAQIINEKFQFLALENAEFKIDINEEEINKYGVDGVGFLIKTNKGHGFSPLSMSASGGELSRVMLAIKATFNEKFSTDIYIFDEIDSGVSGIAADKMAQVMNRISEKSQLIVITHNPQVLAYSDMFFIVKKDVVEEQTITTVKTATDEEKIRQIAQVISHSSVSDVAISQAKNLMNTAFEIKKK